MLMNMLWCTVPLSLNWPMLFLSWRPQLVELGSLEDFVPVSFIFIRMPWYCIFIKKIFKKLYFSFWAGNKNGLLLPHTTTDQGKVKQKQLLLVLFVFPQLKKCCYLHFSFAFILGGIILDSDSKSLSHFVLLNFVELMILQSKPFQKVDISVPFRVQVLMIFLR